MKKQLGITCDCEECGEIRSKTVVGQGELLTLDAHTNARLNDVITKRVSLEMPRTIIVFGLVTIIAVMGWYSWQAEAMLTGSVLGLALLLNGWTIGVGYTRAQERIHQQELKFERDEYRKRLHELELGRQFGQYKGVHVERAARSVIAQAKVRDQDLDSDDDTFMYEVPSDVMMALSDAVEPDSEEAE